MTTRPSAPHDFPREAAHESLTLDNLLRWRAERQPAQRAYSFVQDDGGEQSLTYGELDARARAVAASLRPVVPTGGRVLLLYPPGLEYVVAFFGCLYAGAVAVPAYPPRKNRSILRLQAIVADAKAAAALTTAHILARVSPLFAQNPYLEPLRWMTADAAAADEGEWQAPPVGRDDLAFLQYTSGSTGTPKGVMLTHRNLLHNAALVYHACSHTPEDSYVSWLPTFHDMGFMAGILQPLYGGFPVTSMSPAAFLQRPARWLQAITQHRATTSGGPNFAYDLCARKVSEEERAGLDLSSWGVAFNGAEPIRAETLEAFAEAFAPCGFRREAFYPCYGLAEATLMVTGSRRDEPPVVAEVAARALEENRVEAADADGAPSHTLVGCGRTMLGQRLEIVHPELLRRCEPGEVGEIWVSGESVAAGYWNRPDETEHTFRACVDGDEEGLRYLRTGDLGFMRGGELFVTGRLKDLIIIRGLNHYPQDIERTVEQCHESLRPGCGAAFSVEAAGEERLVVVQELHHRQRDGREQIIADIREAVAGEHDVQVYAVVLIRHGSIPKTSSGKIQRHACRAGFLERSLEAVAEWRGEVGPEQTGAAAEAGDAGAGVEAWLAAQAAARLRVDASRIDVREPLTRYGLDSLVAIELKHQIESSLGVVLPLVAFLEGPSVAQLAAHVEAQLAAAGASAPWQSAEPSAEQGLSRGQQSLWFLHRLAPESTAYNLVSAMRVRTPLDPAAFARALQALAERHHSLRTTFHALDGRPVQRVHPQLEGDFAEVDASAWDEARLHDALFEEAHKPFDLEAGPLLRVRLYAGAPGGPVLLFTLHHIIVDLWSLSVLMHELGVLYEAEREGAPAKLAPVALQYGDYVRWQEEMLAGAEGERLWAYWQRQLGGDLPVLNLPTDRPRPHVQTYRGASHPFRVDDETAERIRSLGHAHGATLYMTLLAVFQVLLHRYTGQQALLVGSPTAGRNWAALAGAVGYFINPIVLRADFEGDPTFETFLGGVRQTVIAALEHQDFPFSLLVERLQPERDPARSPLFQTMFGLHKAQTAYEEGLASFALGESGAQMEVGGLLLESYGLRQRVAQFDLTLTVAELGGGLAASLEYNADLFDASTAARMAGHFARLLAGAAADPRLRLSRLPLLTEGERSRLLHELNDTRAPLPETCVHQLFERQAARTPDAIAVSAGGERLTYRELSRRSNQLARHLRSLGAGPESRVGVMLERSAALLVALLGVLKSGAAYVPLDPSYPAPRLSFMLEDSCAPLLLTEERLSGRLDAGAARVVRLDADWQAIAREDASALAAWAAHENLAYVIYTSGSTGRPKGVMVSHGALVNLLEAMRREPGLEESDVLLAVTTLSFDIAALELYLPLLCGARLELATREETVDAVRLRKLIDSSGATVMQATPATWRMLLEAGWDGARPLKVLCGGEAFPRDLADELCRRSASVWNMYGPTETTVWSLVERVGEGGGAVAIGRPIANTQVYILDTRAEPVVVGVSGELYIGGAGLARGYAGRPALTAERFVPDPFSEEMGARLYRTGDFARVGAGGAVECLGRGDQQVKVRGYRIELGEIEAALRRHESVADCAVAARGGGPGGARLVAYVVPAGARAATAGAQDAAVAPIPAALDGGRLLATQLRARLREQLPEYMAPTAFVVLNELPLTPNGKVDRGALPEPEPQRGEAASAFASALKPSEEMLAGIWQEVLQAGHVGPDENFFELGGHSLLATQVVSRVRAAFGVELPLHTLFESPTVRSLAASIESAVKDGLGLIVPPIGRAPRDRELPLSYAQQRLWFLDQLEPGSPFYNSPATLRLKGALDAGALRRSLSEIARRHEVLRTTFTNRNGRPAQVISPPEEVALPLVDLTHLPLEGREQAARELAAEEALKPFDLSTGPLLRVTLLRLAEDEHVALFTMHHIVCDGWSVGVLVRELSALYAAYVEGRESPLAELPVQYADYAVWQREWLRGGGLDKQLTYWRRQLGGRLPVLELPTDRPRPAVPSVRGARLSFTIGRDLTDALTALSRQEGATLFMTLLAAFQTLLGRYAKQRDVIVGTAVAGRNRAETEGLIGFFVNMLALRGDLSGNPPFNELLRRVREVALGAYVHQDLPFDKLVEELQPERDPTGTPIFRVAFGLDNVSAEPLALPGLTLSLLIHNDAAVRYDLTLWLEEVEGGLAASWTYRADIFDAPTIARMHGHFEKLLASIVAQPDARLSALEILTEEEKRQKLAEARGLVESKGRSLSGARRKVTRPLT